MMLSIYKHGVMEESQHHSLPFPIQSLQYRQSPCPRNIPHLRGGGGGGCQVAQALIEHELRHMVEVLLQRLSTRAVLFNLADAVRLATVKPPHAIGPNNRY